MIDFQSIRTRYCTIRFVGSSGFLDFSSSFPFAFHPAGSFALKPAAKLRRAGVWLLLVFGDFDDVGFAIKLVLDIGGDRVRRFC